LPFLIIAYLVLFGIGLIENSRGALYPEMLKLFQITTAKGLFLFAFASLFGMVHNYFSFWWLKRFNSIKMLRFHLVIKLIGILGIALSAYFQFSFICFLIATTILGVGIAGSGLGMNILVARVTTSKRRRRLISGLHAMYGISSLIGPFLVGLWLKVGLYWPLFFFVISLFPLALLIATYFVPVDRLSQFERLDHDSKHSSGRLLRKSDHCFYGALFACCVGAEFSLSTQIAFYCQKALLWDAHQAAFMLSLFFLFLGIGRLSFFFFQLPGKTYYWIVASVALSFVSYSLGLLWKPFFIPFTGLFLSIFYPCGLDWISQLYGKEMERLTGSISVAIGLFVVPMHFLIGIVTRSYSIKLALMIGPIFLFVGLLLLLLAPMRRPNLSSK